MTDHTFPINELPSLTEFQKLPSCNAHDGSNDDSEDDLIEYDEDEPVSNSLTNSMIFPHIQEKGKILRTTRHRKWDQWETLTTYQRSDRVVRHG